MAVVTFPISDGLTFVRWRSVAGYMDMGTFVRTDAPGERTGHYGKWHVSAGDGTTAFPHNGQQIPAECETSTEVPAGPEMCVQCMAKVIIRDNAP